MTLTTAIETAMPGTGREVSDKAEKIWRAAGGDQFTMVTPNVVHAYAMKNRKRIKITIVPGVYANGKPVSGGVYHYALKD